MYGIYSLKDYGLLVGTFRGGLVGGSGSLGAFTQMCHPPSQLPSCNEARSFILSHAPHDDGFPCQRLTLMEPCDHGLKSLKLLAKINLLSFRWLFSGIFSAKES